MFSFLSFDQSKTDTYHNLMKFVVKRKFLKDRLNRYLWGGDVAAIQSYIILTKQQADIRFPTLHY